MTNLKKDTVPLKQNHLSNEELFAILRTVFSVIAIIVKAVHYTFPNWFFAKHPLRRNIRLMVFLGVLVLGENGVVLNFSNHVVGLLLSVPLFLVYCWTWTRVLSTNNASRNLRQTRDLVVHVMGLSSLWDEIKPSQVKKYLEIEETTHGVWRLGLTPAPSRSDDEIVARLDFFASQLKLVTYNVISGDRFGKVIVDFYTVSPELPDIDKGSIPYPFGVPNEK
jgi:hypothetical protein